MVIWDYTCLSWRTWTGLWVGTPGQYTCHLPWNPVTGPTSSIPCWSHRVVGSTCIPFGRTRHSGPCDSLIPLDSLGSTFQSPQIAGCSLDLGSISLRKSLVRSSSSPLWNRDVGRDPWRSPFQAGPLHSTFHDHQTSLGILYFGHMDYYLEHRRKYASICIKTSPGYLSGQKTLLCIGKTSKIESCPCQAPFSLLAKEALCEPTWHPLLFGTLGTLTSQYQELGQSHLKKPFGDQGLQGGRTKEMYESLFTFEIHENFFPLTLFPFLFPDNYRQRWKYMYPFWNNIGTVVVQHCLESDRVPLIECNWGDPLTMIQEDSLDSFCKLHLTDDILD